MNHAPDVFAHDVVDRYLDLLMLRPHRETAADRPFRHSDSGGCARAIGFAAARIPPTDPPDQAAHWVMQLGTLIHDDLQRAWAHTHPHLEAEAKIEWEHGSGHADAASDPTTVEIKTVSPASFDIAIGVWRDFRNPKRKEPKGPGAGHLMQGALNAVCRGSDELVIVYLCREPISRNVAEKLGLGDRDRFRATWTYGWDQFAPWAAAEQYRVGNIVNQIADGRLPARAVPESPDGSVVRAIPAVDDKFPCGWCNWRSVCSRLGSEATVEQARRAVSDGGSGRLARTGTAGTVGSPADAVDGAATQHAEPGGVDRGVGAAGGGGDAEATR